MSDRTRLLAGAAVGALIGGVGAYLVFTQAGRQAATQINPALDDLSSLLLELRRVIRKTAVVAQEAGRAVDDVGAVLSGADLPADV